MLNMGFVDDVEKILGAGVPEGVQTLLFSATLPAWVKDITKRFLQPSHVIIDLVGNERMKVCLTVTVVACPLHLNVSDSPYGFPAERVVEAPS